MKNEEDKEPFLLKIGEDNLPQGYGGRTQLVALQDVLTQSLACVFNLAIIRLISALHETKQYYAPYMSSTCYAIT